jgi:hypothetical protein
MTKGKLLKVLSIFKKSREEIANDFIGENIEVYTPMFEYENDTELMKLAISKYFTGYVNLHFEIAMEFSDIDKEFSKAMLVFLKSLNVKITDTNMPNGKDFFSSIMLEKQRILEEIICVGSLDSSDFKV